MNIYKCEKCNKIFNHKHNYIKHSKRKNNCNKAIKIFNELSTPFHNSVSIKDDISQNLPSSGVDSSLESSSPQLKAVDYGRDESPYKYNIIYNPNMSEPICVYCNQNFSSNSHRNRHMNNNCIIRQRYIQLIEIYDKEINDLTIENNFLKNKYLSLYDDKYIYPFGLEKFPSIDKKDIEDIINDPIESFPKLIEKYHFNPKKLQYHNIRFIDNTYIEVYNGKKWELDLLENVIIILLKTYKDIIDLEIEKMNILSNDYNNFSEEIYNIIKEKQAQSKNYKIIYQKIYKIIQKNKYLCKP